MGLEGVARSLANHSVLPGHWTILLCSTSPFEHGDLLGRISSDLVNNGHLFSNYYLENQIEALPEWIGDEHPATFRAIKAILRDGEALLG